MKQECFVCGASVKPWFETCFDCHQQEMRDTRASGRFADRMKASEFMEEMGIDHW